MSIIKSNPKKAREFLKIRDNNKCTYCDDDFSSDDELSIVCIESVRISKSNKNLDTSKLIHNKCNILLECKTPIELYERWIFRKEIFQKEVYSKELKEDIFKQLEHLNFPHIVQEKIAVNVDTTNIKNASKYVKQSIRGRDFCDLNGFKNCESAREISTEIQISKHANLRAFERFKNLTEEILRNKLKISFNLGIATKDGLELWKSENIVYFLKPLGLINCKPATILVMTVLPYETIKLSLNEALISQRSRKYKKVENFRSNLDDIIRNLDQYRTDI